ncbi:cytochrome P450 4C1-like [Ostrinia nubilalis]|uniref:cytochrome P450 4C1-like n=1 Tax=Ostrinia nubilalis TaxID=29057 RepID=UPI003082351A
MYILLFVVVLCGVWVISRRKGFKGNLPPTYPGCLPIIGHAHLLVGNGKRLWNLLEDIQRECLKNDGVMHFKIGPMSYYAICDPEDYFTVMGACLEKNYFYRKLLSVWVGDGLVTAPVTVWKKHQKLLYPAFGQQVVDGFIGVFNSQARTLVNNLARLTNMGPFEHLEYIGRVALEANLLTAFGLELNEKNIEKMEVYMRCFDDIRRIMIQRIQNVWMHNNFVYGWTELKKRQEKALKTLQTMNDEIIQQKRRAMKHRLGAGQTNKVGKRFKGFMDLVLELVEEGVLTDQEIRGEVDTMVLAGYDTSSTTAAYTCVLLGSYPDVQEKVYAELEEVFGNSDIDVEKHDLSKLVYLDAVLKEVGRLYPVTPIILRYVDKDVKLRNYTMPEGSNCAIFLSGVSRHKVWGADKDQFRPERWLENTVPENCNAYTGFSTGRRACIGRSYALTLMKITLVHILRNYRIKADHRQLVLTLELFLKPAEGCKISLEPRQIKRE